MLNLTVSVKCVAPSCEVFNDDSMTSHYSNTLRYLIFSELLHHKDHAIYHHCEEKMAIAIEILEIFAKDDLSSVVK